MPMGTVCSIFYYHKLLQLPQCIIIIVSVIISGLNTSKNNTSEDNDKEY